MAIEGFEELLHAATSAVELPGTVVTASDATGKYFYAKAFGPRSLKALETSELLQVDAIFWLASMTKLMTSIAALQCVERGHFTLDEDVTRLLPELKDIAILKGFEEGTETPILVRATKTITLRQLLLHSSGLAYDIFTPILQRWRRSRGEEASLTEGSLLHRYTVPLVSEPGESFNYSPGLDWAGQMVERANNMSLGSYMQKYMWEPLGITNMAFHLQQRPDMLTRLSAMTERGGGSTLFGTASDPLGPLGWTPEIWLDGMADDCGGAGGYGSAVDYQKILDSITAGDNKLLGSKMLDELFKPQLGDVPQAQLEESLAIKEIYSGIAPSLPIGLKFGYALGGMVVLEDIEGRRRKGSMHWAGLPNMYWWADRVGGVSGVYATQLIPSTDLKSTEMFRKFEQTIYERVKVVREGNAS